MRLSNSGRRAKSAVRPTPPRELIEALRVNIDNLRPWEYGNMESDEYMRVLDTQQAYRNAMKMYPPQWDAVNAS